MKKSLIILLSIGFIDSLCNPKKRSEELPKIKNNQDYLLKKGIENGNVVPLSRELLKQDAFTNAITYFKKSYDKNS